ncbi:serine hydrolase domain-containing protein [Rhodococcus koreensis]|uniref:serine hydrolase domain-containing protein n=1 Tax=Rhodococcus koreensis TaxID=99653 RepID=UPI00197F016B|nr:serine hydrolase domain-containing protein [Rhodococcus koreensis]QSE86145.1 beta-lactamase family protein [Rhodococcus koreensis]
MTTEVFAVGGPELSRRAVLGGAVAGLAVLVLPACSSKESTTTAPSVPANAKEAFNELDAKIDKAMKDYAIPGVAVGVIADGEEYIKGYGVTNVDHPTPVDGDTLFRIGSTTKTFTGTTVMRLVDEGKVDLEAPIRQYLPDFAVADPEASATATVRQLLNHTSGWLGDDLQDFGRGDDAITKFVASMTRLPQKTSPGTVFAYNNAGLVVAGRIVEVVTGSVYEDAVQKMLLDPLELSHTRFFSDQIVGRNIAASHNVDDGKAVVDPGFWFFSRSCNPTGSLISSVRDQVRYARFHLGDGTTPKGDRLMSKDSLIAMRSNPGVGGTLQVELTGMGVSWMLRPSAENETIVQHGGTWAGQRSGFFMVPSRNFAMTVLTNSEGGAKLLNELFAEDWSLRRFAGISNLPATPQKLSTAELAPYEGVYATDDIDQSGTLGTVVINFRGKDGQLVGNMSDAPDGTYLPDEQTVPNLGLALYKTDYGLDLGPDLKPTGTRSNFVRGSDGNVAWFSNHGRLYRHLQ